MYLFKWHLLLKLELQLFRVSNNVYFFPLKILLFTLQLLKIILFVGMLRGKLRVYTFCIIIKIILSPRKSSTIDSRTRMCLLAVQKIPMLAITGRKEKANSCFDKHKEWKSLSSSTEKELKQRRENFNQKQKFEIFFFHLQNGRGKQFLWVGKRNTAYYSKPI